MSTGKSKSTNTCAHDDELMHGPTRAGQNNRAQLDRTDSLGLLRRSRSPPPPPPSSRLPARRQPEGSKSKRGEREKKNPQDDHVTPASAAFLQEAPAAHRIRMQCKAKLSIGGTAWTALHAHAAVDDEDDRVPPCRSFPAIGFTRENNRSRVS
jgi:hypothetical protein